MSLGSVDDDVISAMLESSHGSSLAQGSLAGVIAPATSPDIFASFSSHASPGANFHQAGGLARASSMSQAGLSSNPQARHHHHQQQQQQHPSRGNNQPERWAPMTGDEKWMLNAKGDVLAMHAASNSSHGFGADFDSFMPTMMNSAPGPPSSSGLHRYHSAPSTFLQSLAEDAFSQIPAIGSSTMGAMFSEGGLTPITEQMDVERSGSGNSMNEFEHFLAPDSDFSRRAALSALGKPENSETFANLFPPGKNTGLVRQKSLPVAPLSQQKAPRQDSMEEHHSEESLSGTSEDNSLVNGLKVSMYDDLFSRDTPTSWPTSPGTPGGSKRARGFPLESDPSSGSADNAKAFRLNNIPQNGLIRHASLPTPAVVAPPNLNDDHYVQMRARAKRGCATHPRSIAERVRRTRISERMKKLQDLVPNMEKTTNTSDMLDETVEYVKSLQMQVSELNETIAKLKAEAASPPAEL